MSDVADTARSEPPRRQRLRVLFATGRPQERRLLAAFREDVGVRIVARCSSAPEVISLMQQQAADVALLDEDLHLLGDEQLGELDAGRFPSVVLTRDPDADRWRGRSVYPVPTDAEATTVLLALAEAFQGERPARVQHRAGPAEPPAPATTAVGARPKQLQVFAFWSGAGSPGRTTLAINWSTLLGSVAPTILVDLDLTGAGVAAQLDQGGRTDGRRGRRGPHLGQLAAAAPDSPEAWRHELERTVQPLGPFSPQGTVLYGVPRPSMRTTVTGAFVDKLIAALRGQYTYILLDLGDEPLGETSREAAVGAAALRAADQIVVVCPPDGPGLHQTSMALLEAGATLDRERAAIIVNRYDRQHHPTELARVSFDLGMPLVGVLPIDARAMPRALADGRPVVCDPRSRLRRPLQELAERVHGGRVALQTAAPRPAAPAWGRVRAALTSVLAALTGGSR